MSSVQFDYSDGDAAEESVLACLRAAKDRSAGADLGGDSAGASWPLRYHLSQRRANLLRHLDCRSLRILELGAGMGAVSRFLGEHAARLVAVEPSARRAEALRLRLEGLPQCEVQVETVAGFATTERFDLVCVVGVLEYAELFSQGEEDPWQAMLQRARSFLRPGGVLLLAIENQLGAKYLTGCTEDHSGKLFDGVLDYPITPCARTFSRRELRGRLDKAGLDAQRWYFPFPDYKLPAAILDERFVQHWPEAAADLACNRSWEDYSQQRADLLPDYLFARSLSNAGLLADFANSFLVLASDSKASPVLEQLTHSTARAWLFGDRRRNLVLTRFEERDGEWLVRKTADYRPGTQGKMRWHCEESVAMMKGIPVRARLLRRAWFHDPAGFVDDLETVLRWGMREFADQDGALNGEAIDAVYTNLLQVGPWPSLTQIDREWCWHQSIPVSWYVLRNLVMLSNDWHAFSERLLIPDLQHLYVQLCVRLEVEPRFLEDIELEVEMQSEAMKIEPEASRHGLLELFARKLPRTQMSTREADFIRRGAEARLAHQGLFDIYRGY